MKRRNFLAVASIVCSGISLFAPLSANTEPPPHEFREIPGHRYAVIYIPSDADFLEITWTDDREELIPVVCISDAPGVGWSGVTGRGKVLDLNQWNGHCTRVKVKNSYDNPRAIKYEFF